MSSYIHYKGIQRITPEQSIELQKRILENSQAPTNELRTHSAVKVIEKRLTAEQCIELQKRILDNS